MKLGLKTAQTFKNQKSLGIREESAHVVMGSTTHLRKGIQEGIIGREGKEFIFVPPKLGDSINWLY